MPKYLKKYQGVTSGTLGGRDDGHPMTKYTVLDDMTDVVKSFDLDATYFEITSTSFTPEEIARHKATHDNDNTTIADMIGCTVEITYVGNGGMNTKGKRGVIDSWDGEIEKYKIDFGNGWCGSYRTDQFKVIEEDNIVKLT